MKYSSRIVSLIVLASLSALTSGCAFGTRHAQITYPPEGDKPATNATPAGVKSRIVVQAFDDVRADRSLVGNVRNGFGSKTAKVVSDGGDLSQVVSEAVRSELQKSGYEVVQPGDPGLPALSGSLTAMYCDAFMSYEGAATLFVRVNRDGKEVFKKSYEGKGSVGMNWAGTGTSYGKSLSLALKDAVEVMIRDLPTALSH